MLICDTSGLLAFFDASDDHCASVTAVVDVDPGPFVISPYVVAELDYLVATRIGMDAELDVLEELSSGAWELAAVTTSDLRMAHALIDRYRDQNIGVADASIVVLAQRYHTDRVLTLDRRQFRVLRTMTGDPFKLLPDE